MGGPHADGVVVDLLPGSYLVTFFYGDVTLERRGIVVAVGKVTPLFQAIHVGQQRLFDKNSLVRFYSGFGANPANFANLYNSFAVSGKVAQGKALAQQYGLDGVPAVVVNGKYLVKGSDAKVLKTVNELIAKERLAAAKKK